MEYMAGGTLAASMARERPTPRRAAEIAETLARATHAAHERGIVHRDLKPGNVMLAADGTLKIADFGLAKRMDDTPDLTRTGEVLGTPAYMAPEQAAGDRAAVGPATDVYAVGAILYELLAGRPPFAGDNPLEVLRQVADDEPIAPSRLQTAVPRDLEAICLKCLEKSPARRYPSAQALADDLRRFLDGLPVVARRAGPVRRVLKYARRHPWRTVLIALAASLALLPVGWEVQHLRAQQQLRRRAEELAPEAQAILRHHCYECHGQKPDKVEKKLNVLNHASLVDSDRRIVVPGKPDDSRLIQRIADGSMPLEEEEKRLPRLTEEELNVLREWIAGGAPEPLAEASSVTAADAPPASPLPAEVKRIFIARCYECHKFDAGKGGIKILHHRLLVHLRKVVVPGKPDESELFHLITTDDAERRMPPESYEGGTYERLPPQEIETIRQWILEGAPPFPKGE
jgi:mono/diheme cytochrome c family protein